MSKLTASKLARHDFDKTTEGIQKRIAELQDLANTRHVLLTDDLQSLKEIVHPFHYQDKAMTQVIPMKPDGSGFIDMRNSF